jgi:hypothetical protein
VSLFSETLSSFRAQQQLPIFPPPVLLFVVFPSVVIVVVVLPVVVFAFFILLHIADPILPAPFLVVYLFMLAVLSLPAAMFAIFLPADVLLVQAAVLLAGVVLPAAVLAVLLFQAAVLAFFLVPAVMLAVLILLPAAVLAVLVLPAVVLAVVCPTVGGRVRVTGGQLCHNPAVLTCSCSRPPGSAHQQLSTDTVLYVVISSQNTVVLRYFRLMPFHQLLRPWVTPFIICSKGG